MCWFTAATAREVKTSEERPREKFFSYWGYINIMYSGVRLLLELPINITAMHVTLFVCGKQGGK